MPQFEVLSMFPVPLYVGRLENGIGAAEARFIQETEYEPPTSDGNRVSRNRRILDAPALARVKAMVLEHLDAYCGNVLCSDNRLYITQSWTNRNGQGTQHQSHYHANSVLSGTLYFGESGPELPPDTPPIVFKSDRKTAIQVRYKTQNIFTADSFSFRPNTSVIVLFPSILEHFVPVNQGMAMRTSLAFNTFVKGELGEERNLTALHVT
jgi:uncharacterized protein (TIGR02466 family)